MFIFGLCFILYFLKLSGTNGFSRHLCDYKFKYGFLDSLNPICSCRLGIETTCCYLLHCLNFTSERSILLNSVSAKDKDSFTANDAAVVKRLLHGTNH